MNRDTPTFNLKAVVQETGIKPDTLRAWERRYGLPDPNRSSGGHRLYSQRDIDTLIWLMARQDEGLTISRAVDLWRSIEEEDRDPLRVPEYSQNATSVVSMQGEEIRTIRKHWVDACMAFDERAAERALAQAFAIYPVETVCIEVLQKGLQIIGEGWYEGNVSVQQEHFASALAMRRLDAMLGASPMPTRTGRILMACPPGEEHIFGQTLLQLLLRRRGWETIYLGANVPLERLESSVEMVRPHLVLLTAQRLQTAATLKEMAELLHQKGVAVGFGGRIFTELESLRDRIPGYFLGETIKGALDRVQELVPMSRPLPAAKPISPAFQAALSDFQFNMLPIGARVTQLMHADPITSGQTAWANLNLAQNVVSALQLGDIDLLGHDIEWLTGLLSNHQVGLSSLGPYLQAYAQAASECLNGEGEPIVSWLDTAGKTIAANVTGSTNGHGINGKDEINGTRNGL